MTRTINASTVAILDLPTVRTIILVEIVLAGQTLRLCSASQNVTWNGNIYLGNSWLKPIDGVEETTDIGNFGFQLLLSSVDVAALSAILNNPNRGEPCSVWLALLSDTASPAIVGAPVLLYKGLVDSCEIDDKIENPSVLVNLENDLARFDTSQNFRFSTESQSAVFPGDRGFEYLPQLETWSGYWGRPNKPPRKTKQKKKSR